MKHLPFANPVWVFASEYFCRQIASSRDAVTFLREWTGRRADWHSNAIAICIGALSGAVPAESAREAFVRFAEREQILVSQLSGDTLNAATAGLRLVLH